jgi:hypothetical protein
MQTPDRKWQQLLEEYREANEAFEIASAALFKHVTRRTSPTSSELLEEKAQTRRLKIARRHLWDAWRGPIALDHMAPATWEATMSCERCDHVGWICEDHGAASCGCGAKDTPCACNPAGLPPAGPFSKADTSSAPASPRAMRRTSRWK